MIEFNDTPLGKKILKVMPLITQESMQAGRAYGQSLSVKLKNVFRLDLRKRGLIKGNSEIICVFDELFSHDIFKRKNAVKQTDSMTSLLKLFNADISAVKANRILVSLGLLEEKERPSSKYAGKIKKFKALTEQGLQYGVNTENPNSPGQTTPHYFVDTFDPLLLLIKEHL